MYNLGTDTDEYRQHFTQVSQAAAAIDLASLAIPRCKKDWAPYEFTRWPIKALLHLHGKARLRRSLVWSGNPRPRGKHDSARGRQRIRDFWNVASFPPRETVPLHHTRVPGHPLARPRLGRQLCHGSGHITLHIHPALIQHVRPMSIPRLAP